MEISILEERIEKAQIKIAKLESKLAKLESSKNDANFIKRYDTWQRDGKWYNQQNGLYDLPFEEMKARKFAEFVEEVDFDIRYATRDLTDAKKMLIKYENQLDVENQKQNALNGLPEIFTIFKEQMIKNWDAFDIARRERIKEDLDEFWKTKFESKYAENEAKGILVSRYGVQSFWSLCDKVHEIDEEIHRQNEKDVKHLILDFIKRTEGITGTITSFSNLYLAQNNQGFSIFNGYIEGEKGKAKVESILAGGYNIQRLHIRVLVKSF